jgi:hypothetical protein
VSAGFTTAQYIIVAVLPVRHATKEGIYPFGETGRLTIPPEPTWQLASRRAQWRSRLAVRPPRQRRVLAALTDASTAQATYKGRQEGQSALIWNVGRNRRACGHR